MKIAIYTLTITAFLTLLNTYALWNLAGTVVTHYHEAMYLSGRVKALEVGTPIQLHMTEVRDDTTGAVMELPDGPTNWKRGCEAQNGTFVTSKDGSWRCDLTK